MMSTWNAMKADARAVDLTGLRRLGASVEGMAPFWAVVLYRLSHLLRTHRTPAAPLILHTIARLIWSVDLHPDAEIGPGLTLAHPAGVVVGSAVVAGADLTLFSGVVLGGSARLNPEWQSNQPRLGNRILISANAVVAGGVHIGDDVVIGANAVVLDDVPAMSTVRAPSPSITPRVSTRSQP
jgi:serine O-acetyltransferase